MSHAPAVAHHTQRKYAILVHFVGKSTFKSSDLPLCNDTSYLLSSDTIQGLVCMRMPGFGFAYWRAAQR